MSDVKLYDRNPVYIPRVAAVHDMCGYGKCSLTAAIPILSAAGCDVCPVPTGLFSSHTKYPVFTFHDTTEILNEYLDAWGKIGVGLDGVYSGFLGSADQVAVIQRLYREYPDALRLVDPVMGDGGQMYPTYTAELCEAMGALADGADVLMPNLTEASILTGRDYPGQNLDDAEVTDWLDALLKLGAKNVVLKGIDRGDGFLRNYVASAETGAERKQEHAHEKLPYMIHGTGDAFASALCGAVRGRGHRRRIRARRDGQHPQPARLRGARRQLRAQPRRDDGAAALSGGLRRPVADMRRPCAEYATFRAGTPYVSHRLIHNTPETARCGHIAPRRFPRRRKSGALKP